MIIVADTSPIGYLILIKEIEILPKLYGTVVVPQTVHDELVCASAPEEIRLWMDQLPSWLEVRIPATGDASRLIDLDAGERDAILLANELKADRLIIDDKDGRREAVRRGIAVIGTLGVLRDAAALQFLDIREAIQRLQSTSFRVAPEILANLLDEQF